MIGHGVVQGTFTALRGGKFKTGFISGIASKAISGIMDSMGYDVEPTFSKSMINAILSGLASKAAGGDFVEGAMSAMVVWLYNCANPMETDSTEEREKLVIERAKAVVSDLKSRLGEMNPRTRILAKKYIRRINYMLSKNRVRYNPSSLRYDIKGHPEGAKVFGYAKVHGWKRITLTSLIWDWYKNNESLLIQKIDYDIVHETKHTIIENADHPGGEVAYDIDINNLGYYDPVKN